MRRALAVAALAAAALPALGVLSGCGGAVGQSGTGAGSLPFDGRSPLEPSARRMRVLVQLRRPSLATQVRARRLGAVAQRAYVSSLGDEARALQSALEAKGVRLRRPVLLARVWNGFAATVDAGDLPQLRALGLRAEPVRRFYGAASASGSGVGEGSFAGRVGGGKGAVALLDSGVDAGASGLAGRIVRGFDAVGGKRATPGAHGTRLAQVLAQALGAGGGTIVSVRVAGVQRDRRTGGRIEVGTTDQLLAGLERTVDPNGDGDTSDHIPVALVGVNSPYAGFADSPDAVGAGAARALGTLVVAPAGNEGRGGGSTGTVGSPAAAPGVLAVGALEGGGGPALPSVLLGLATSEGRALLRGTLLAGGSGGALRAPVASLAGPSQASPRERSRALGGTPLEYFAVDAKPRARGRVVIVPARPGVGGAAPSPASTSGPSIAARAAAAAQAGAAVLVVCEPDPGKPLNAIPDVAPGLQVVGLRGEAAAEALALSPHDGGLAFLSKPQDQAAPSRVTPAPTSSRGPTYSLAPKPDIAALGTAGLDGQVVAGTSVAAARVAAAAAATQRRHPTAKPDDIAAALVGSAHMLGPATWTGAGTLDAKAAPRAAVLVEPSTLGLARADAAPAKLRLSRSFTVANLGAQPAGVTLKARLPGLTAAVTPATVTVPPGARQSVTLTITGNSPKPSFVSGRLAAAVAGAQPVSATVGLPVGPPPPAKLGRLSLVGTNGVTFTAGALTERDGLRSVEPLGLLRLQLTDAQGKVARELTPTGGAPDLLPGEYAYTLTRGARKALGKGTYSFSARARGPAGGPEVERKSPTFTIR